MKIGIITFHNVINYGAVLQTLATQTVLTNMGEDASVVNYTPPKIDCIYKPFSLTKYKLHAKKSLFVLAHSVLSDFRHFVSINRKRKHFADFCNRFLNLDFKKCKTYDELKKHTGIYDACIAGSDQIWNPDITSGFDKAYFLHFGDENMKRLAYAASIGRDNFTEAECKELSLLLKKFDAVSMREDSAANLIKSEIGVDCDVVLDPTLLLSGDDWITLMGGEKLINEPYIFVYTLYPNSELDKYVEFLSKEKNLPVVTINPRKSYSNELINNPYADPSDFVKLISGAEYVVTNSFHGTAFSVNFSKKFTTFKGSARNSRITDLLNKLGLGVRAVKTYEEALRNDTDITGYDFANQKLNEERIRSVEFIKKSLKKD